MLYFRSWFRISKNTLQKKTHQALPKNANALRHEQIDEYLEPHLSNPSDEKSPKVVAKSNDKEQYVLHMKNLEEYSKMGLVLNAFIEL